MAISIKLKFATGKSNEKGEEITETKTFVASEIKGRALRKAFEFENLDDRKLGVEVLDELVDYVCSIFGHRFSVDEFYDGVAAKDIVPECMRCVNAVIAEVNNTINSLPNSLAGK